jgi:hypothetical protein
MDTRISERNSKFISRLAQYLVALAGIYFGMYYILHLNLRALAAAGNAEPGRQVSAKHILESAAFGRKPVAHGNGTLPPPKVLVAGISEDKVSLTIAIWVREVQRKAEIVSDFLTALQEGLKKEGIPAK